MVVDDTNGVAGTQASARLALAMANQQRSTAEVARAAKEVMNELGSCSVHEN